MEQTADEIRLEEINVENKIETVAGQLHAIKNIEEEYNEFFDSYSSYASELLAHYEQASFSWYLEDQNDGLQFQQKHIFDSIRDEEQSLKDQQYSLEETRDELYLKRRTLLSKEDVQHG